MQRRLFLKGLGGAFVGLPVLESLITNPLAQAAPAMQPYAIFVYQPMGPDYRSWWPTTTGKITAASLQGRGTAPLIPFADRISIIKGLGHGNESHFLAGDHGESIAMTLSGARVTFTSGGEGSAVSDGPSIDHAIAKELQGKDASSLNLATPDAGGPGLSWSGPGKANAPEYDPLKAYRNLFPNGENPASKPTVDEKAALRKGVNDLVRDQIKALMSNPKISAADKDRVSLHMQNIRDLENEIITEFKMPDADRDAITNFKGNAQDNNNRRFTIKMQANILAIAAASGQKRAMTLQLANTFMDSYYNENGERTDNGWHDKVSHGDSIVDLKRFDLLNQQYFAYLLNALDQYKFKDNDKTMLDYGVTTFIMSLGFGAGHWRFDLPHIVAGSGGGKLKTGQFIDVIAEGADRAKKFVPTNRLFSTIAQAVAPAIKDFNAGTAPRDANVRLDQRGVIPQIIV
ncbi:MAG: DUF1552 domain-containing protein [Proteobacteria bacterium]|nr:MAG: DUF1552 domain-containing protein [Pseudomonadota bacterium]